MMREENRTQADQRDRLWGNRLRRDMSLQGEGQPEEKVTWGQAQQAKREKEEESTGRSTTRQVKNASPQGLISQNPGKG